VGKGGWKKERRVDGKKKGGWMEKRKEGGWKKKGIKRRKMSNKKVSNSNKKS
jgi:hypothetical protein